MHYMLVALVCPVRDVIVFQSRHRFYVDGRKKFKYATCGHVFRIRHNKTLLLLTFKTIKKIQRANATAYA